MHLVTYRKGRGAPRLGVLLAHASGEVVLDAIGVAADLAAERGAVRRGRGDLPHSMQGLIEAGPTALAILQEAVSHGSRILAREGVEALHARKLGSPRGRVHLEAPIPRPARNVFCLGRNYAEHAAERGAEVPTDPVYFTKPPECVIGPGGEVAYHAVTKELDYEVELAAVIGRGGRGIARGDALAHVFGYTVINDVTARDLQKRHGQWFKGKSLDTFCPMGPVLVTAEEIPDPQALSITLRVNGETRQRSHTSKMIFPVAQCIEVLSHGFTLRPGDVIATGTPDGVGAVTGRFLQVGDTVEAEVERVGILTNTVVAPTA